MITRLEQNLIQLAQKHAPHVLATHQSGLGRVQYLMARLAKSGLLVMVGDVPEGLKAQHAIYVRDWVVAYLDLYQLLAEALFPSFAGVQADMVDALLPPVVYIKGQAAPVIRALDSFVVPYVARRQNDRSVSEVELRGLIDTVVEELEGEDLSRAKHHYVRREGIEVLHKLLRQPVRQVMVTSSERLLFKHVQPTPPMPTNLPEMPRKVAEPPRMAREDMATELMPAIVLPETQTAPAMLISFEPPRRAGTLTGWRDKKR